NRKNCSDVSFLNKVNTLSDHRVVRACFRFDIKQERKKLIKIPRFPTIDHIGTRNAEYQAEIARRLQPEEILITMDIEQLNQQIKPSVAPVTKIICCKVRKLKELTTSTVELMDQRGDLKKERKNTGH
ncbi:hypothetical protein HHI36_019185, partial [Cryptolaemus montrouzieri]